MNKEVDLSVSCLGKVKELKYDVIILPWGATEPHNLHLPYLTDCILPHDIAVEAAELALSRSGVRCMVMPPVPFGAHNPGSVNCRSVSIPDMPPSRLFWKISYRPFMYKDFVSC